MTDDNKNNQDRKKDSPPVTTDVHAEKKTKNYTVLAILFAVIAVIFVITIIRLSALSG
jgi:hypothetical protein